MTEHTVSSFRDELEQFSTWINTMGEICLEMIGTAYKAAAKVDKKRALDVLARDKDVDELEFKVEQAITRILALRTPVAVDLRHVLASLRISRDLERIGDLSKNIGKRAALMDPIKDADILKGIKRMGKAVKGQLAITMEAYHAVDAEKALQAWGNDEEIDELYNSYFREVLTFMMSDQSIVDTGAHVLFIAKNLERIGDHCTNIAESVHFMATGDDLKSLDRPRAKG